MRSSAPARLDRVRSQRRRNLLLSKHQQGSQHSTSQTRSALERLSISKLVDHLSIEDLEELNQSLSSLPPLHPCSPPSSPSGDRRRSSSVELPPVDPKAHTVRTSNRTIDKMYGSIPRPRRSSSRKRGSPWECYRLLPLQMDHLPIAVSLERQFKYARPRRRSVNRKQDDLMLTLRMHLFMRHY
jgi:hypothetical protein